MNPGNIFSEKIYIEENRITLSGNTSASAPSFVGYTYKVVDNNLYIGMKYNLLFGFFKRLGHFDITINYETKDLGKIYFKDGSSQKLIWEKM
jgi:hypothetical protein